MKRIIVQVDEATLSELDELADDRGASRSGVVRIALERFLAEIRRQRDLDRSIASFRRRPQDDELVAPKRTIRKAWPD